MQMFSIARERQNPYGMWEDDEPLQEIIFLRLEPNGNVMWTLHKELASQFQHWEAEEKLQIQDREDCYLVEAVKSETV